ncbi:MAG TPA: MFS transporter, partial [Micromonosporaceae bacterium]
MIAFLLSALVLALAVVVFPQPAAASELTQARAQLCSVEEWQVDIAGCVDRLADVAAQRAQCLKAPTPDAPDSGLAGWFASRPDSSLRPGATGKYSQYGYAGYSYTTYDIGCAPTLMHPDYKFENTVANGEFMIATAVIGAANALRERAWDPGVMWSWADPLVEKATRSIYTRVFTVFGAVTLVIVGLYLLWRSRQAEMSAAMTTAGWAILVMIVVTALASWPVFSAHLADKALISSLGVVHDAVGPPAKD